MMKTMFGLGGGVLAARNAASGVSSRAVRMSRGRFMSVDWRQTRITQKSPVMRVRGWSFGFGVRQKNGQGSARCAGCRRDNVAEDGVARALAGIPTAMPGIFAAPHFEPEFEHHLRPVGANTQPILKTAGSPKTRRAEAKARAHGIGAKLDVFADH